jgi:hypothetical protein
MRISHKHKFIFYAINKTGSSSIRDYFYRVLKDDYDENITVGTPKPRQWNHHHNDFNAVKKHFETIEYNYDDYIKFAFIRNPWDRELSIYHFKLRRRDESKCPAATWQLGDSGNSFKEWIKSDQYMKKSNDVHAYQHKWLDFNDPKFFAFSYENLQKDFDSMIELINAHSSATDLPKKKLSHRMMGQYKHIPYTEYYDEEMVEIVSKKFAKDIEIFNYKFGE